MFKYTRTPFNLISGLILAILLYISPRITDAQTQTTDWTPLTLAWKRSPVWTGIQAGPQDAYGRLWNDPLFIPNSSWIDVTLRDTGSDSSADDRYYRAHFIWDGYSQVKVHFASDDGLAIYINGWLLGSWGFGWRSVGCVNNPGGCGTSTYAPDQVISPSLMTVGDNVIAVDLWNGAICCGYILDFDVYTQPLNNQLLDLPVSYSNFAQAAQGNVGGKGPGRVNSWFDHTYPNYGNNQNIAIWSGAYYTGTTKTNVNTCNKGVSCYDGHNGIDFKHNGYLPNEPIYAAAPGIVTQTFISCIEGNRSCPSTGVGAKYGNQVWIDHGNGYATLYAHLQAVSVTVGTQITDTASQPLGIMGNTGNSIGTHLHFGLYFDQNGDGQMTQTEVVDPYGWSGQGTDPWTVPGLYLWKYPLQTQQLVSSTGGNVTSPSGNTSVNVPAGAVTSTVTLELWDTPPVAKPSAQLRSIGQSFLLQVLEWITEGTAHSPHALTSPSFSQPITVTVTYSDTALLHLIESQLTVYRWDESSNSWVPLSTIVNANQNQTMAQTIEIGNFDLQAPLVCPADTSESNDDYYTAVDIPVDGTAFNSLFDAMQDEDWFRFDTIAGGKYVIQFSNLAAGVDTAIQIYDMDGLTPIVVNENDGGDLASRVGWQAPMSSTYFARVSRANDGIYGCSATYQLSIEQNLELFLPLIWR